ncbi:hypothetical protein ACLK1S_15625 [Escherichia coli]
MSRNGENVVKRQSFFSDTLAWAISRPVVDQSCRGIMQGALIDCIYPLLQKMLAIPEGQVTID